MKGCERMEYTAIVVGCGFAGSVIARELAEKNEHVLLIDKRNHIGGNMFEEKINGITIHKYGPHLLHTNNEAVYNYIKKYTSVHPYNHKVTGFINGKYVPIPINFKSIDILFSADEAKTIKDNLILEFGESSKISVLDAINSKLNAKFGEFVYENVFKHYTEKQWGICIENIDEGTLKRVPIIIGYENGYFNDKFQFLPSNGYNCLFESLLNHKNITLLLNTDSNSIISFDDNKNVLFKGSVFNGKVYYTGALDHLFNYQFGELEYRTINFSFESINKEFYQSNAVINYPNTEDFTRITEFKHFTNEKANNTCILKEYPQQYSKNDKNDPLYPINNSRNNKLYQKYLNLANQYPNLILCGRLAQYKYYNMDAVIESGLTIVHQKEL